MGYPDIQLQESSSLQYLSQRELDFQCLRAEESQLWKMPPRESLAEAPVARMESSYVALGPHLPLLGTHLHRLGLDPHRATTLLLNLDVLRYHTLLRRHYLLCHDTQDLIPSLQHLLQHRASQVYFSEKGKWL